MRKRFTFGAAFGLDIRLVVAVAATAFSLAIGCTPARAGLDGDTVQAASYLNVTNPPPAASPTECTIIDCNILDYEGMSGPTNSPLPTVPVTYLEDVLTATTVAIDDTQITITNNLVGLFCPNTGCTPGDFSGYGFTFTGGPDITDVTVDNTSAADFQPVAGGLSFTTDSITVNVAGDNLAEGDQLILDVTTNGTTPPSTVPEPATWTTVLLGLVGLGFTRWRRTT